jgi:hypothetical protein
MQDDLTKFVSDPASPPRLVDIPKEGKGKGKERREVGKERREVGEEAAQCGTQARRQEIEGH